MIEPSPQDIADTKALARQKFGHDRLIAVTYFHPATGEPLVEVLFADLSYVDAVSYYDARSVSILQARSALICERLLWPAAEVLGPLREEWGALDTKLERELRGELGFVDGGALTRPLTLATAPPGLSAERAGELLKAEPGRLWSVYHRGNGLACVLRQPQPAVWHLSMTAMNEAHKDRKSQLCPSLDVIGDHSVWCPAPTLRQHIEERPGRAVDLNEPWCDLGGAAAKTSARRF